MTIPYREWLNFQHWSAHYSSTAGWDEARPNWVPGRQNFCKIGWQRSNAVPNVFTEWRGLARPINDFVVDLVNLNLCIDFQADVFELLSTRTAAGVTHVHIKNEANYYPASPNTWDSVLADAVFYDGVNYWCLPAAAPLQIVNDATCFMPFEQWNQPYPTATIRSYGCRYSATPSDTIWNWKWQYENHGLFLGFINPAGAPAAGEEITFNLSLKAYRLYYLNPVCNSLSRYSMPPAGGVEVKLYGLGFHIGDTELEDTTYNPFNDHPPGGWKDEVYHIEFRGLQGQATITLHGHAPNLDFTVDSNMQITIPAAKMPAMPEGSYEIYLRKDRAFYVGGGPGFGSAYAYAGDWRAETSGRLYRGSRIVFLSGTPGTKKKPIVFSKWKFKSFAGSIFKYYAPIDVMASTVFYDGRILEMSSVSRGSSGREGLFLCSDMTATLANHDKEFSKLLAQYFLKNQIVEFFYGWADDPEGWKVATQRLIVDDYTRAGKDFRVNLRDITTKCFKKKVPLYRCTEAEFPNLHKNHLNRPKPEVLGVAALTTIGQGGAVEAVCIDTIIFKYLAARGSLYAVTAVYKDGVLQPPGLYAVSYGPDGATYITFTADQEDAKITFDCKGYMFPSWDSANGFVQNPAYILAFHLCLLMEVPLDFIDMDSIDALAQVFVNEGESLNGYLVLQKESEAENILKELLFTMGALQTFDFYGRFYVVRKGLSVLGTDLFVFAQIDTMNQPEHCYNLKDAINRCRYRWQFYPGQEIFAQGATLSRDSAITDFEQVLEAPDFIDFPWTLSASWAARRAEEELQKYGYGLPEFSFELPLAWIEDLDVLTDFRLQDPFGTSRTGAGEYGRYCYVSSIDIDYLQARITIRAVDLNWLIKQYLMLGDEDDLPAAWVNATDEERIFAYLCDEVTGRFPDGEIGKKLVDENMV